MLSSLKTKNEAFARTRKINFFILAGVGLLFTQQGCRTPKNGGLPVHITRYTFSIQVILSIVLFIRALTHFPYIGIRI